MNWSVFLTGNKNILDHLTQVVNQADCCIKKEHNKFILLSQDFENIMSSGEVRRKATELIQFISGTYSFVMGCPLEIGISDISFTGQEKQGALIEKDLTICYNIEGVQDWPLIGELAELGTKFPEVTEVLKFFADSDINYFSYYKIYEIIKEDSNNDLVGNGYVANETLLKKLTCNLNHPKISGEKARHARMNGSPGKPEKLMTQKEIHRVVKEMVYKWLNDKLKSL